MPDTVYRQKGSTCVGFAVANAIEHITGESIKSVDIYDYFDKEFKDYDGVGLYRFLRRMKRQPLGGVKIDTIKKIFNSRSRNKIKNKLWMGGLRRSLAKKDEAVILLLKIREGKPKMKLDKFGFYQPSEGKVVDYHAVYLKKMTTAGIMLWKRHFLLENSWGKKWGLNGYFHMDIDALHSEVQSAYSLTFK